MTLEQENYFRYETLITAEKQIGRLQFEQTHLKLEARIDWLLKKIRRDTLFAQADLAEKETLAKSIIKSQHLKKNAIQDSLSLKSESSARKINQSVMLNKYVDRQVEKMFSTFSWQKDIPTTDLEIECLKTFYFEKRAKNK